MIFDELSSAGGRADETGIAAKRRVANLRLGGGNRKSHLVHVPANPVKKASARRYHAASKHNHVWIDGVHHVDGAYGQIEGRVFDNLFGQRVLRRSRKYILGRDLAFRIDNAPKARSGPFLAQRLQRSLYYGGSAGIGFETTPAAATALPGPCDFNPMVPNFSAMAVFAFNDLFANDDAAAHACPQSEEHHAVCVTPGAYPILAEGRRIGVVLERGRQRKRLVDILTYRHVLPGMKVRGIENDAGRNVHRSGCGHAYGLDLTR